MTGLFLLTKLNLFLKHYTTIKTFVPVFPNVYLVNKKYFFCHIPVAHPDLSSDHSALTHHKEESYSVVIPQTLHKRNSIPHSRSVLLRVIPGVLNRYSRATQGNLIDNSTWTESTWMGVHLCRDNAMRNSCWSRWNVIPVCCVNAERNFPQAK